MWHKAFKKDILDIYVHWISLLVLLLPSLAAVSSLSCCFFLLFSLLPLLWILFLLLNFPRALPLPSMGRAAQLSHCSNPWFVCSTVTRLRNIQPHLTGLWSLANTSIKVFYLSLFSGVLQSYENDSSKYFVSQKCTVLAPRGTLGTGIFSPSTILHACFYIWTVFNWETLGITWFAARLLSCHFIA